MSDAGNRKVSEASTPERASPVHKYSQEFSPGTKLLARKSSRKNLFARERDAANRQQSNEDTTATISRAS